MIVPVELWHQVGLLMLQPQRSVKKKVDTKFTNVTNQMADLTTETTES
jgi:hypothetical protein